MPQVTPLTAYRVDILEYERGWGSKVEDTLYFDNEAEAVEHVRAFNASNDSPNVPDWYMVAVYKGAVR